MSTPTNILFKETQRFRQAWLITLFAASNIVCIYGVITQVVLHQTLDTELGTVSNASLVRSVILIGIVTVFILSIKLETLIKKDGVYVRMYPLHRTYRFYKWGQIGNISVRKYNALLEYGGWGLRGLGKKKAYNVSGNRGLQLEFTNGNSLLIGTQKAEELTALLQSAGV